MLQISVNVILRAERIGATGTNLLPIQDVPISNIARATGHSALMYL
jgi:hypothetical protein